jgi:hypothetical protein
MQLLLALLERGDTMRRLWLLVAAFAVILADRGFSFAMDILRCGQSVPAGQISVLQVDLNCPSLPGSCTMDQSISCMSQADCPPTSPLPNLCSTAELAIGRNATLMMNGHTVSGQRWGLITDSATITGPGDVTAPGTTAIVFPGKRLRLSNLVIHDSGAGIEASFGGQIQATDLVVRDNDLGGIDNSRAVTGTNITVSNNGKTGGSPPYGFGAEGINAVRVVVDGLTADSNGGAGVLARNVRLKNAALSGNNGFGQGYDVLSWNRPVLKTSSCVQSGHLFSGPTPPVGAPPLLVESWHLCPGEP